ncbi:MAG TPA: Ig-like domain-containing protein [Bacilli bacterium]|nr:Ig-like domain-containing protein [Bacilli bacterium]
MIKKIKEWLTPKEKNKIGRPKLARKELIKAVKVEIVMAFVLCATLVLSGTSFLTGKSPLELLGLNNQNKYFGSVTYQAVTAKKDRFVVADGTNTQNVCHKIYIPTNTGKNWRIHVYYKKTGASSYKNHMIKYQYTNDKSKEVCFKKQKSNKETYRILVKWTTNTSSDIAKGTSGSWEPTGWSYNSDIGWAYKDYTIDWSKVTTTVVQAKSISLNRNSISIKVGEKYSLKATIKPNDTNSKTVTWSSSNKSIVSVINGNITGIKRGNATITAKTKNGKIATAKVKVTEEIDVALFWGQSNMLGRAGKYSNESNIDINKNKPALQNIIYSDILENYTSYKHVDLSDEISQLPKNTAYEFKFNGYNETTKREDFYLQDISTNPENFGENIKYIPSTNKMELCSSTKKNCNTYYSLQQGSGTNIIPYFAKTYYELTGHKLIIVLAAYGAQPIENFLPEGKEVSTNAEYIYEAMVHKYNKAIEYLTGTSNNYNIVNKFYIVFQGEGNVTKINTNYTKDNYYNNFKLVHNNLINDLNLSFGAIIKTGYDYEESKYKFNAEKISEAQQNLIEASYKSKTKSKLKYELAADIILATDWGYNAYINNIAVAFCPKDSHDNTIHFNSASLSQIGRDSAISIVNYMSPKRSTLNKKISNYSNMLPKN